MMKLSALHRLARLFVLFRRKESGVAAAEFALMVPVFALSLVMMLDVAMSIHQRMELDRVLRTGGQLAMSGEVDVDKLKTAVFSASTGPTEENLPPSVDSVDYTLEITKACECGGASGTCSQRCSNSAPPSMFFNFKANQTMDTLLVPEFDIESELRVQVR